MPDPRSRRACFGPVLSPGESGVDPAEIKIGEGANAMRRRTFVKAAGAVLGASALGFPFIRAARGQLNVDRSQLTKTLRFSSYGGSWQAALSDAAIKPFEAKYGVQVLQESHASEAALIAKMKASGPG